MKNRIAAIVCAASIAIGIAGFAVAQNRPPTKGHIPDEAFRGKDRALDLARVPDYVVVYDRNGDVAGYLSKAEFFVPAHKRSDHIKVVDESLSRTVGRFVKGRGFVPLGTPDEEIPDFEREEPPSEAIDRSPSNSGSKDK
jgi:hypothetical protein